MDADGNDNTPEWGYCEEAGCKMEALPLWFSGSFPDDADLFLCMEHIGRRMGALEGACRALVTACDTAPPMELMQHIGAACDLARAALGEGGEEKT
jgi:hypothetical protein